MRILLINWLDPANPQAGGAEIHLQEVFSRIVAQGHEVVWLASGWRGAEKRDLLAGIELHRTGSRYTFGPSCILYYRRHLARYQFDVVVEALNKVPVYAPAWARGKVVLLVHHLFGTAAFQEASIPIAALTWLQERPLSRVYGRVPIETISESTKSDLVDRGLSPERIEVVYPGVDLDFFHPATSPIRARVPTFLYLGRLRRYKRVDLILRAFARVLTEATPARLIIAGRGDDESRLRTIAGSLELGDSVNFVGFVSEEEKRTLFRSSWANVFVSPKEGWGITNLEAAACGTPTVASDSPGLRESVIHERTGLVVPHGDVGALSAAMLRVARDVSFGETLGREAVRFASAFTWELSAQRTELHLVGVINGFI